MKKIIILVVAVMVVAGAGYFYNVQKNSKNVLRPEEAKAKVENFINTNFMQPGKKAVVKEITEEEGLYKVVVDVGSGKDIDSYITKDGKKFFPQVMVIEEIEQSMKENANNTAKSTPPASVAANKMDKPEVEIFVMSYCPFGTQIEKGILPVLETLGDKIDFKLKFCDYAMHGKKEIDEQLAQYCIQKEQNNKFISYLKCFLTEGKSSNCLTEVGVNKSKLDSCIANTDKQFKITEMYNDKSTWKTDRNGDPSLPLFNVDKIDVNKYGIAGSPGLVINGEKIQSNRDPASLLKVICSGFNKQPDGCKKILSSDSPSAGFGFGNSAANSGGGCEG